MQKEYRRPQVVDHNTTNLSTTSYDLAAETNSIDFVRRLVAVKWPVSEENMTTMIMHDRVDMIELCCHLCMLSIKHLYVAITLRRVRIAIKLISTIVTQSAISLDDLRILNCLELTIKEKQSDVALMLINAKCKLSENCMYFAVVTKQTDVIERLISVNCPMQYNCIWLAIVYEQPTLALYAIDKGYAMDSEHVSRAIITNQPDVAIALINAGCKPASYWLYTAIRNKQTNLITQLFEMKCVATNDCLLAAIETNQYEVAKQLINMKCGEFSKCLTAAIDAGQVETANAILDECKITDRKCLLSAITMKQTDIALRLISMGCEISDGCLRTAAETGELVILFEIAKNQIHRYTAMGQLMIAIRDNSLCFTSEQFSRLNHRQRQHVLKLYSEKFNETPWNQ